MWTIPLQAQVSFGWSQAAPNLGSYEVIETCLAHYENRVNRTAYTASFGGVTTVVTVPREVIDEVRQCAGSFTVEQLLAGERAHINAVENAYRVLLAAEWSAKARTLATNWLASLPPADDSLWRDGVRRFARLAIAAFPSRWDDAWALIDGLDRQTLWRLRFSVAGMIMDAAYYRARDTTEVLRAARWLLKEDQFLNEGVTDSARRRTGGPTLMYMARQHVQEGELMDSLRRSTRAYLRHLTTLRAMSGVQGEEVARQAQPIHGEYWFPARPASSYPTPGRVSLVLAIADNECKGCTLTRDVIKRFHQRFPDVQFTLVTKTHGYHSLVIEPPAPEVEARLVDSVYRKVHQIPATLVVHHTQFKRIDEIDRRRINFAGPNDQNYPRFVSQFLNKDAAYVIDRDGIIVARLEWDLFNFRKIELLLAAVVRQSGDR